MASTRLKVLSTFKKLHKTRLQVFQDDAPVLAFMRNFINDEFRKNKNETDVNKIDLLLEGALEAESVVRSQVIQAKKTDKDTYKLRITKDTQMHDNIPFNPNAELPKRGGRKGKCGSDDTEPKPDS